MALMRVRGGDQPTLLKRREPADRVQVVVVHADGTDEAVEVPDVAVRMLADLLEKAARGGEVVLLAEDAEISPEDAATILGISRPLVRQRMERGELPFRRVGAHRRISRSSLGCGGARCCKAASTRPSAASPHGAAQPLSRPGRLAAGHVRGSEPARRRPRRARAPHNR